MVNSGNDLELGNINYRVLQNYTITNCLAWGDYGHENYNPYYEHVGNYAITANETRLKIIIESIPPESTEYLFIILTLPNPVNGELKPYKKYEIIREEKQIGNGQIFPRLKIVINGEGFINWQSNEIIIDSSPLLKFLNLSYLGFVQQGIEYLQYWRLK